MALLDWLPATRGWVKEQLSQQEQRMNAEIKAFKEQQDANNAAIKANLANVAGDIANLNGQIQALNAKVQAGTFGDEEKAALAALAADGAALVSSTQALADTVPDAVAPPAQG